MERQDVAWRHRPEDLSAFSRGEGPGVAVRVFLTGDGVLCARKSQKTPDGYYNVERMIKSLAQRGEVAT